MITLSQKGFELDIQPELGAGVSRFSFEGKDVLRRAPAGVSSVLEMGVFPLVPYANRIAHGRFRFEGKEYQLPLNFGDHPHALHGHGWQTAWRTVAQHPDSVRLAYEHAPDAWPWAYAAEQVFTLGNDGLSIRLSIGNLSKSAMPVSLGLHPYFPRLPGSRLKAAVEGMWESDATMIPIRYVKGSPLIDLPQGVLVSQAPFVDNAYTGWTSPALIEQPELGMTITLAASPECKFLHVFVPVGQTYFCAEPVTAMPNAVNRPEDASVTGARTLPAGESFSIEMQLGVRKQ